MARNLKPVTVYVEREILDLLAELAKSEDRPLSNFCARILIAYVARQRSENSEDIKN